ncbi:MAG: NADH-quinone oxidoreductase subunit C [Alphaproteobacteria bacterium]|nr:NADH-quinone oxidoreductase subunit C [Alphaproteobacteria bacterium]
MSAVERSRYRASDLPTMIRSLHSAGGRMQMAYAWYPRPGELEVRYLAGSGAGKPFVEWAVTPDSGSLPSMAAESPLLGWYEREITDLFGLEFSGHPEPKRLILHEGAEMAAPPMREDFPSGGRIDISHHDSALPELENPNVQRLPWGPIRADVVESGEFIFYYVGVAFYLLVGSGLAVVTGLLGTFLRQRLAHA